MKKFMKVFSLVLTTSMLFGLAGCGSKATSTEQQKQDKKIVIGLSMNTLNNPFFVDVKNGMEFFDNLVKKYDLKYTPTIVVANLKNNKSTKFEGADEISEDKVLKAIDKLKK